MESDPYEAISLRCGTHGGGLAFAALTFVPSVSSAGIPGSAAIVTLLALSVNFLSSVLTMSNSTGGTPAFGGTVNPVIHADGTVAVAAHRYRGRR
ncbi:hypothetical protein ACFVTC_01155 [Streptomyces sp. NPDC057950]|uniref:hypothetical protein n=1 Tax=Streptomyces sp. NPDC057950 TaxID=3346288 RepID=UPI0036E78232